MFVDTLFALLLTVVTPVAFLVASAYEIDYRPKWWPYPTRKQAAFNLRAKRLRDAILLMYIHVKTYTNAPLTRPLTTEEKEANVVTVVEEKYDRSRILESAVVKLHEVMDTGFLTVASLDRNYICCLLVGLECSGIRRDSHWDRMLAWSHGGAVVAQKSVVQWRAKFVVAEVPTRTVKEMFDDKRWFWRAEENAKNSLIGVSTRFGEDPPLTRRHP